ncbi:MAG TPA: GNAT family N-acetyltransferase [Pseudorhodoplanes sp.]|nr:GNAT family N-acetyltransferase [Pseudorhodoplanes sp.]
MNAGVFLVRTAAGQLAGLFPARRKAFGLVAGYVHPYAPLGVPLVDRKDPAGVIHAWLSHLAGEASAVLLPLVPDGPFAEALDGALGERHLQMARFGEYQRAALEPGDDREHYLDCVTHTKGHKGLVRRRKRLAELGALSHRTVHDPDAMKGMVADFLALENSGWKGRAGTAAQRDPKLASFVEKVVIALAREHKAYGEVLSLNGTPIASTIIMRSADTAWAWKIAYDETYARCSPGMQVAFEATRTLLADRAIARADSCTPPGQGMIDHLWRERINVSDRLFALAPGRTLAFQFHRLREKTRRAVRSAAKSALHWLALR